MHNQNRKPLTDSGTQPKQANHHAGNSQLVKQEEKRQDLGFGTKVNEGYSRLINKDGSFNVNRSHESFWNHVNLYHRLITMRWKPFLGLVLLFYLITNALFAGLYVLAGVKNLTGVNDTTNMGGFWEAYFFSAQTLTTVGYGRIAPIGMFTNALAAIESLMGVLAFALATGLLYGRFSRPVAHIRFSKKAVLAPYLDVNGWMFRIVNERYNQLIDLEVEVSLSRLEKKEDGSLFRKYYSLKLERNKVSFFPMNWTVVHAITDDSPLYDCTPEDLAGTDAEFLIILRAIDDTFSQTVHVRNSYRHDELLWGRKFKPMFDDSELGLITLDLSKLSETIEAPLNS